MDLVNIDYNKNVGQKDGRRLHIATMFLWKQENTTKLIFINIYFKYILTQIMNLHSSSFLLKVYSLILVTKGW